MKKQKSITKKKKKRKRKNVNKKAFKIMRKSAAEIFLKMEKKRKENMR